MSKYEVDDWQDVPLEQEDEINDWVDVSDTEPSIGKTVLHKAAQGISFGLSDEISGVAEAAGRVVGVKGIGEDLPSKVAPISALFSNPYESLKFSEDGPTLDWDKIKQGYVEARDRERKQLKQMQDAHPVTSTVAEVIPSLAIPTSAAAKLGTRIAMSAGQGALTGFGMSEADDLEGIAKDTAVGGILSGGFQAAGDKLINPALKKGGEYFSKAARFAGDKLDEYSNSALKKAGKVLNNVPEDVTERYLARPNQINEAQTLEEIGEYFKDDALEQFQQHLGKLDAQAWQTLKTTPTLPKNDILEIADDYIQKILGGKDGQLTRMSGTGADADIINVISKEMDKIKTAYGSALSEADLKSLVQSLQKAGWSLEGSPKTSVQGKAIQQLSGIYNDFLKNINKDYAEKMVPVQEATSTLQSLNRQFMNQAAPDQLDKFISTAKRLNGRSPKTEAVRALDVLDSTTGAGIKDSIKDRLAADAFTNADTNGSRKTLLGAILGKAAGGAIGGAAGYVLGDEVGASAGAVAGFSADKYAGKLFKAMLDGKISWNTHAGKLAPKLGNYTKILSDAASRGNKSLAATHFILSQQDPEYRARLKSLESNDDGQ